MNMGMGMDMGMDMDNLARHYSKLDEIKASSYPVRVQAALCRSARRCSKLDEIKASSYPARVQTFRMAISHQGAPFVIFP